jgi:hypothetical protein
MTSNSERTRMIQQTQGHGLIMMSVTKRTVIMHTGVKTAA